MGKDAKVKAERIHRRQLFDGRYTAEQVHRASFPPDARCKCGSPKVAIRARIFMPAETLVQSLPELAMQVAARNEGNLPVVDFRGPGDRPVKFVRIGDAFACDICKSELEKTLAKGPQDPTLKRFASEIVVHIDRGPGPENPIVQVM